MNQISERAIVFASRMKARNESESTIRTVLAEFDLSEAELGFVLKEAEQLSPFRDIPAHATEPSKLLRKWRFPLFPSQSKAKQVNPLVRAKNGLRSLLSLIA